MKKKTNANQKALKALKKITEAFIASHPDLSGMESINLSFKSSLSHTPDKANMAGDNNLDGPVPRSYTCYSPSTPGDKYNFYDELTCADHGLKDRP